MNIQYEGLVAQGQLWVQFHFPVILTRQNFRPRECGRKWSVLALSSQVASACRAMYVIQREYKNMYLYNNIDITQTFDIKQKY